MSAARNLEGGWSPGVPEIVRDTEWEEGGV